MKKLLSLCFVLLVLWAAFWLLAVVITPFIYGFITG
jgi:hypothetical protein